VGEVGGSSDAGKRGFVVTAVMLRGLSSGLGVLRVVVPPAERNFPAVPQQRVVRLSVELSSDEFVDKQGRRRSPTADPQVLAAHRRSPWACGVAAGLIGMRWNSWPVGNLVGVDHAFFSRPQEFRIVSHGGNGQYDFSALSAPRCG